MRFISNVGLKNLDNYEYKGSPYSWLDNKINPFWEFLVTLMPKTMAPNLITFIGWTFVIMSYSFMMIYDYTFKKEIPRWTFFFAALCIFLYINLDAIDGKQARRTKSGSPLGQLFDHGCDSFSLAFFVLAACQAFRLERNEVLALFIGGQVAFWTSNWMEYHTGILQTSVGNFGVTQVEIACITVHILTGIFGQNLWNINLDFILPQVFTNKLYAHFPIMKDVLSIKAKFTVSYILAATLIVLSVYSFAKTFYQLKKDRLAMVLEWSCMIMIVIMQITWATLSIYDQYAGIMLTSFGILTSLIISKVIISSVTKMKLQYFHGEIVVFLLSTVLMVVMDRLSDHKGVILVFWVCFAINLVTIIVFLYSTINQITKYLGICCFSLKRVPRKLE